MYQDNYNLERNGVFYTAFSQNFKSIFELWLSQECESKKILCVEMKNVTNSHDQNQAHPHPNPYYCDPSYGQGFNQMDSMSQNMTSNRLHEWNDRQGNWGTGGAAGPPPGAGHDSGIHTRDSSAAPSVMSSAYSAFSQG